MKIKKGDEVKIQVGKDKGKTGKVERVFTKKGKILVSGVNLYKRHVKARSQREKSDIVTVTLPIYLSNAVLICPNCRKETRVGFKIVKNEKMRVCKECGKEIN